MKKLLTVFAIAMAFGMSAVSAKTETQIKNEEKAKAYKEKQAQKKAAKAAKAEKKAAAKGSKKK